MPHRCPFLARDHAWTSPSSQSCPCGRGVRPRSERPGAFAYKLEPLEGPPRGPSPLPNLAVVVRLSGETLRDTAPASLYDAIRLTSPRAGRQVSLPILPRRPPAPYPPFMSPRR
jgi:hypothetical protein